MGHPVSVGFEGGRRHPTTTPAPRDVRSEDQRPILGPRPHRGKMNSARPEKRGAVDPATPNTDRGPTAARSGDASGCDGATKSESRKREEKIV
ncbi:hypothetical protein NDU88_004698 [Pleurodeles waltl]|uniref:Uncharacterized protein n=1 Tax=Pleurodeles waltl TaxID=8319 RepID=A0AAV7T9W1_PLEWA|nr:hypothetical protein NDU88_004698 [Pleurodeles waltl]